MPSRFSAPPLRQGPKARCRLPSAYLASRHFRSILDRFEMGDSVGVRMAPRDRPQSQDDARYLILKSLYRYVKISAAHRNSLLPSS